MGLPRQRPDSFVRRRAPRYCSQLMSESFVIRRATAADLPALGKLGASLLRAHYGFDPQRFMAPHGDPEAGYGWFLEIGRASCRESVEDGVATNQMKNTW